MRLLTLKEALLLSILLHILAAASVVISNWLVDKPQMDTVTIELLGEPSKLVADNSKAEKKRPIEKLRQQIVEQEETKNNIKPEDSRFLSKFNQKVEKQVVAKNKGQFKNVENPSQKVAQKVAAGERSAEKQKGGNKVKPKLTDLNPDFNPFAIKERQQQKSGEQARGGDFTDSEGGDVSQTDDYIRDIQTGDHNSLNTREFKYYTYYNRIRRQLSHHWEPKVRQKLTRLFRQGRRIASDQDHITKLLIVLDTQGLLVKVQVLGASGVRDLDDAAMEAFRSAAPFPNPPKGIIEADGTVKIRWDFVLES